MFQAVPTIVDDPPFSTLVHSGSISSNRPGGFLWIASLGHDTELHLAFPAYHHLASQDCPIYTGGLKIILGELE